MRRRGTWLVVGACAALAAITFVARSPNSRPWRVWTRAGVHPSTLYASPGGPILEGWTHQCEPLELVELLEIAPKRGVTWSWLRRRLPRSMTSDVYMTRWCTSDGWDEWIAVAGPWPTKSAPDARWCGLWQRTPREQRSALDTIELTEDGSGVDGCGAPLRWACLDGFVLLAIESERWEEDRSDGFTTVLRARDDTLVSRSGAVYRR